MKIFALVVGIMNLCGGITGIMMGLPFALFNLCVGAVLVALWQLRCQDDRKHALLRDWENDQEK